MVDDKLGAQLAILPRSLTSALDNCHGIIKLLERAVAVSHFPSAERNTGCIALYLIYWLRLIPSIYLYTYTLPSNSFRYTFEDDNCNCVHRYLISYLCSLSTIYLSKTKLLSHNFTCQLSGLVFIKHTHTTAFGVLS